VAFDPVDVAFEQAAAMAAIANEFVTNAYKHAFPAGRMGRVAIRGTLEADGRVTVVLRDDGVGMASGAGGSGLGMRIMRASAQQLGADLDTAPAPAGTGFAVRLRFTPRP
jgi:two-component sensor histidine kinase